ncbi:MAG: acyltransferase [Lentisphaerae bacterium]|nr:acyltransferase [Lentisphaerota bacterium]
MVMVFHFYSATYGRDALPWLNHWPNWADVPWRSFQWLYLLRLGTSGVALFLVMSGFCIHYAYLRRCSKGVPPSIPEFYWQRFMRIYPPYLIVLLCFILMGLGVDKRNILAHLTFTHTFFADLNVVFGISPSFWTLPVEFHLYLLFPLFLLAKTRGGVRMALAVTLLTALMVPLLVPDIAPLSLQLSPFTYWFYWSIGAYVAEARHQENRPAFRWHLGLISGLVPIWILANYYKPAAEYEWLIRSLLSAVIVDYVFDKHFRWVRVSRGLAAVGLISYSAYLWHQPLLGRISTAALRNLGLDHNPLNMFWVGLPVSFAVVLALSQLTYLAIELPSINAGRRLWPRFHALGHRLRGH